MSIHRIRRRDLHCLSLILALGLVQAQENTFTWDFVGSSTLPECGTSTIKIINTRANGSPGSAAGPFTMFSYQPGGTTVNSALTGSDNSNLEWVVPHSAGSQVYLQVADAQGNSGGIAGSLFSVISGASTSCHGGVTTSLAMTTTSTSLQTCEPLVLDFSGGSKPYTISIIAQNSNVVTNVTMGPNDNEFTYINRAPPNAPLIVAAHDSTGHYGLNTNLISLSGPTDTTCNGDHSLSGVKGASTSSTLPAPGGGPATPTSPSSPSQVSSNGGGGGGGSSNGNVNPPPNSVSLSVSPSTGPGEVSPVGSTDPSSSIRSGATVGALPGSGASSASNSDSTPGGTSGGGTNNTIVESVNNGTHVNVAAVAGGVAGGVLIVIGCALCFAIMYSRSKRSNQILGEESWGGGGNYTRGTGTMPSSREEEMVNPFITPAPPPPISTSYFDSPTGTSPILPSTKRQRMMMEQQSPISPESQYTSPTNYFSPTHPYAVAAARGSMYKSRPPSSALSEGQSSASASSNAPLLAPTGTTSPTGEQEYNPYVGAGASGTRNRSPQPVVQHRDAGPIEIPPPYAEQR